MIYYYNYNMDQIDVDLYAGIPEPELITADDDMPELITVDDDMPELISVDDDMPELISVEESTCELDIIKDNTSEELVDYTLYPVIYRKYMNSLNI
jgi:hypothetical protein